MPLAVVPSEYDVTITSTSSTDSNARIWAAWVRAKQLSATTSAATGTWGSWNAAYEISTTSATTTGNDLIWTAWNEGTTSAATDVATSTWVSWCQQKVQHYRDVRISDEEWRAREAARERRQREWENERQKAKERAQILLQENLSAAQREELKTKGHFTLTVIDSETRERRHYRIRNGREGNVEQVDENGRRLKGFCIHPSIACPNEDTMLTQKLWLETREKEFLRVANHRR